MVAIFDFIKNIQGWLFHTHMDIIMGMSNMIAQYIKTASYKPMSTRYPHMLIIIVNCKWKSKSEYFSYLTIILDFEAI